MALCFKERVCCGLSFRAKLKKWDRWAKAARARGCNAKTGKSPKKIQDRPEFARYISDISNILFLSFILRVVHKT